MRQLLKVMKALGDGTRVRIMKLLQHRDMCVCELTATLGLSQSAVSKHLHLLEDAGLVASERQGAWINYRLEPAAGPYAASLAALLRGWLEDDPAIAALIERARGVDRLTLCRREGVVPGALEVIKPGRETS